jgi:hypothetical protein
MEWGHDMMSDSLLIRIAYKELVNAVTKHAMHNMVADEIQKQLANDPDLRILVRECVAEAIRSMNMQEIITACLKKSMEGDNG